MRKLLFLLVAFCLTFGQVGQAQNVVPSYTKAALTFGDYTNARPMPTSGTLTGVYKTSGNWVQTGPITSNGVRGYFGGSVTFNDTVTCATGVEANSGGQGPYGICAINSGAGGSHGGLGGTYPGYPGPPGAYPYRWQPLPGCGGSPMPPSGGGVIGSGGGSFYVEANGPISLTSFANISVRGADGSTGGGAGAGGGADFRSMGTISIASGAIINANGGNNTIGGAGGGGGGGVVNLQSAKSSGVSNSGTVTASGGTSVGGQAGAAGVVWNDGTFEGGRIGI